MRRREFTRSAYLMASMAVSTASGCLHEPDASGGGQGESSSPRDGEGASGHRRWLYDPDRVETESYGDWYGYILVRPMDMPSGTPWRRPYEEFGIESNLKHYAVDGSMSMSTQGYGSVDITRYGSTEDLWSESPWERLDDEVVKQAVRVERPASTGGPLSDQEVVETVDGFDIYERGAAVDEDDLVLVSSPNEYLRKDLVPAIVKTAAGRREAYAPGALAEAWRHLELGGYNEFGFKPRDMETFDHVDAEIAAFGVTQVVESDEVRVTQAEVFEDEESVEDEPVYGRLAWGEHEAGSRRVEGRTVIYEASAENVLTSYGPH